MNERYEIIKESKKKKGKTEVNKQGPRQMQS